jgi:coenzyme F420-0:L-glutamate ligase/coenzyme F420-1:gamma-L-glutamate ligase
VSAVPATTARIARRPPTADELAFVRERRVGRLATADEVGTPAVVPICYAVIDLGGEPVVVSALDEKPKRVDVNELARVRHIRARPDVALVVDDYAEDWRRLAFVHLRGRARLLGVEEDGHAAAVAALRAKYPQYAWMAIDERPVIAVAELTATSWRGNATDADGALPLPRPGGDALAALVRGRRSVRSFLDRPVPRELIEQAIAAAGWAPSPHGRQPWRFAVVEAPERRAGLAEAMAATWRAQLELDGQEPAVVQIRLDKSRQRLREAPVLIVPCLYLADLDVYPDPDRQAAEATMAIQSLGAAVQNLLLTVYAAGLDAGWMCAPLFCPDVVRDFLGLDPALIPHALIAVGYAAKDPVRRDRLPAERLVVAWE